MERDPRTDTSPRISPAAWLSISLVLAAGFVGFFIVPKMEALWLARGMRLPAWATVLIATSHFVITRPWSDPHGLSPGSAGLR